MPTLLKRGKYRAYALSLQGWARLRDFHNGHDECRRVHVRFELGVAMLRKRAWARGVLSCLAKSPSRLFIPTITHWLYNRFTTVQALNSRFVSVQARDIGFLPQYC